MDGLQATRALLRELPETKVIIVSQNDPRIVREQAASVGAHGYVAKGDVSSELVATIERALGLDGEHPSLTPHSASISDSWLNGNTEMAALIARKNWAETIIGAADAWSPSLQMITNFILANRFPMLLWWGSDYTQIYNDAYAPILGVKHPQALGQPVSECWNEIWHVLQPLIDIPFRGGPATWMEDLELEINRSGKIEETHFTVAYSPVPDATAPSGIGGVLATVHEITQKVVGERRVVILRDLGAGAGEAKTAEQACSIAADVLSKYPKDCPFALLYLNDADGRHTRLASCATIVEGESGAPSVISLQEDSSTDSVWPLSQVSRTLGTVIATELTDRFRGDVPRGVWSEPPNQAAVVPVRSSHANQLAGFLIVGISAGLRCDEAYLSFLDLAARQIATSIANARAYEEERKRAEVLAEIDQAKTVFFSNVSHEFRTPLTLMLAPLQDLLARSQTHLSPTAKEQLELVNRNGARLLRLVNTLLDFSRIEAGRMQAVYEVTDLAGFTSELASVFRSATERAGLRLLVNCSALGEPVYVDRDMWEKIVLNLVSNAFKFTFNGEIEVSVDRSGGVAELCVRDTGVGIPPEAIPKLFERFHRVPNMRSRTHEGSGIGLALVQELVKLHGGSIRVESLLGRGTTFVVNIPLGYGHLPAGQLGGSRRQLPTAVGASAFVEEALAWLPDSPAQTIQAFESGESLPVPCPPASQEGASRPRVLIADDNSDMRRYLARLLGEYYDVESVADGKAAMASAIKNPPSLILSDVMMPVLDGFELLKAIRSDVRTRNIPVVLLSARAGEESRVEGMEAGADDYLIKPFSARELLARISARLEIARTRQQGQTLLNAAPLGVYLVDADFRIREVNPIALPIFGDISDLIGRDFDEVIHILWSKDYADEVVKIFRHTLETGEPYHSAERIEHRADRDAVEYYEWSVHRIPLTDGTEGVVCYFRDISSQVHARQAIQESEHRYRELAETLEMQVQARTHQLEQRNAEMIKQSEDVRNLSARLLHIQDEERRHIARELHDSAGQTLVVLGMNLAQLVREATIEAPELAKRAKATDELVQQLHREIRTTSYLLHPPLLDESGLSSALRVYLEGLNDRSEIAITLDIPEDFGRLPNDIELGVFRVVQECATNIYRHSGSKTALIRVSRGPEDIRIEVRDEGRGISAERLAELRSGVSGVGMRGIQERLRQFGGTATIESDGSGTSVLASVPVPKPVVPVSVKAATIEPR
jgi:PAS domain S-box-containing protein